jgi:hypothetical protein
MTASLFVHCLDLLFADLGLAPMPALAWSTA